MFEPSSRYFAIETATLTVTGPDGQLRTVAYKRRRFIPPLAAATPVLEHPFARGERLDTITARYLGDPTQFWQICDANLVLRPEELEEEIGRRIDVAMPRL